MTLGDDGLPAGVALVRTTPEFDERTVPPGLRSSHRIAAGVWGRLVVRSGSLGFVVEDEPGGSEPLAAGESRVIPPGLRHHVALDGPVRFHIEFHR